jgi:AcrR family transcriptional regulator
MADMGRNSQAKGSSSYAGVMAEAFSNKGGSPHRCGDDDVRLRILDAATSLIADGGTDVATTRAVALAAGVQAPTIYRLFGDKSGLLDAAAEHGLSAFVAEKALTKPHADPVEDLRNGWDMQIEFGVANPGLFSIMSSDPHLRSRSPALAAGTEILRRRINRIAVAGRLRVSEERAMGLVQAAGVGTVLTLLGQPEGTRDSGLSASAREAVIAAITSESTSPRNQGPSALASGLRASLNQTPVLTPGEQHLLEELLARIANFEDLRRS